MEKQATREAYGNYLAELGKENPDIVVFDADLSGATKTGTFKKAYQIRTFLDRNLKIVGHPHRQEFEIHPLVLLFRILVVQLPDRRKVRSRIIRVLLIRRYAHKSFKSDIRTSGKNL